MIKFLPFFEPKIPQNVWAYEYLELKMDTMQGCMLEESVKQKEKISELNTTIKTMSRKMKLLEQEVEILTKLSKAVKLVCQITKIPVLVV